MKKKIAILGSTGSIGKTTFNIVKKNRKEFEVVLLTTNKNINEIYKQARILKTKNIFITSKPHYLKAKKKLKKSNLKVFNDLNDLKKIFKKKIDYTMCAISGLEGLRPTLDVIQFTKNIDKKKFPVINILNHVSKKFSLYETVIVSANDLLVQFFLDGKIKFLDISIYLEKIVKLEEFKKFKHILPTNVNQIIKLSKYVRLKTQSLSVISPKP